jgi:hypothetical protein
MKKTRKKVQVYDSLKSAAAGLNIPVELLQEAKGLGCPGFRGSRIYAAEVRAWLDANTPGGDDDSLIGLRKKFLRTQIDREVFRLQALRGEHVPLSEVRETHALLAAEFNRLTMAIENSLPQALQGLSLADQRLAIQKKFDELRENIHGPLLAFKAQPAGKKS